MKTKNPILKTSIAIILIIFLSISCGNKKQKTENEKEEKAEYVGPINAQYVVSTYFDLKDALVNDDNENAKKKGEILLRSLKAFQLGDYDDENQEGLKALLTEAQEHAAHIQNSDIEHQREHFKPLTKNITDLVEMSDLEGKIYEQYCPMYDGGSAWLSSSEQIKNPYYGSSMLKCGRVQREVK